MGYTIENPAEDQYPQTSGYPEWITRCEADSQMSAIEMEIDPNPSDEQRTAEITVTYDGKEYKFGVIQDKKESSDEPSEDKTIQIEILEASTMRLLMKCTPSDASMAYLAMAAEKEYLSQFTTDEELFQDDMKYLENLAKKQGITFEELLEFLKYTGTQEIEMNAPAADIAYYAYAYGITDDNTLMTEIFKKEFIVESPGVTEGCKFEYDVTVDAYIADVTIIPSDNESRYFSNVLLEEALAKYGNTIEEQIQSQISFMLTHYLEEFEITPEQFLEDYGHVGQYHSTHTLEPLAKYIVYAVIFDKNGFITSEISSTSFETTRRDPTDFDVEFDIQALTKTEATISATPSDDTVLYYWNIEKGNITSDEILAKLSDEAEMYGYSCVEEYIYYKCSTGPSKYPYSELEPESEYSIYYISMSAKADLGKVHVSRTFTTL